MANANNAPLKKIIAFYCRFTPSYSKIGYYARSIFWHRLRSDFRGQTWLLVGGSEGRGQLGRLWLGMVDDRLDQRQLTSPGRPEKQAVASGCSRL